MSGDNVHKGHRARTKERFLSEGIDGFADHNVLELLLFYSVPQKDTNPVAHALLDAFGSLHGVFDATHEELCKIPGVGPESATLIKLIPQLGRRYQISKVKNEKRLDSAAKAGAWLIPRFMGHRDEIVLCVCLDSKQMVLACATLSEGTVNVAGLQARKVVEFALRHNAANVILSHNHPSGIALPSQEDQMFTLKIKAALEAVGITLTDHIIVAGDDFVSMAQSGFFTNRRERPI